LENCHIQRELTATVVADLDGGGVDILDMSRVVVSARKG